MSMYKQVLDPVSHSLGLSSIFAALPLRRAVRPARRAADPRVARRRWSASPSRSWSPPSVYPMPASQALLAGSEGAAFGFFPILWIVINAIWIYNLTVATGHFDVLRRSFAKVSDDQRIQGVIIAFCFGALLEALAGFGTPVAITSVMLIALGFRPLKAATVALVANTAPVAFGALAVPITTLATVTGPSRRTRSRAMVGRQTPLLGGVRAARAGVHHRRPPRACGRPLPAMLVCGIVVRGRAVRGVELRQHQLTDIAPRW